MEVNIMPSLMPGVRGAKEVYGIVEIKKDFSFTIPPGAVTRYSMVNGEVVLLIKAKQHEPGFGLMRKVIAATTVFSRFVSGEKELNRVYNHGGKPFCLTIIKEGRIYLTMDILDRFHLKPGDRLLSVKSTTVSNGYVLVEIFREKLLERGFTEAVDNIQKLEVF
jgi:phosphoribosylaminoimidazole (AIR) synthetase